METALDYTIEDVKVTPGFEGEDIVVSIDRKDMPFCYDITFPKKAFWDYVESYGANIWEVPANNCDHRDPAYEYYENPLSYEDFMRTPEGDETLRKFIDETIFNNN